MSDDIKNTLKLTTEKSILEIFKKKLIVEYVNDVLDRQKEICKIDSKSFTKVYSAEYFTGMFIPETENHCSYILAKYDRNDVDTVVTIGHESQHAIDYYILLSLFDNDQEKMINSPIYSTFQIYSEFMAEYRGFTLFFEICLLDQTQQEKVKIVIDNYKPIYEDFSSIHNKFEYIIHSVQHLGILYACANYYDKFDLESYISQMYGLQDLKDIILNLLDYHNLDLAWFQNFDKICRQVMQIGN